MSRSDDPSSRPAARQSNSKPALKAVPAREPKPASTSSAGKKKVEAKPDEKARSVVQTYDADFGVAMLIRGPDEA